MKSTHVYSPSGRYWTELKEPTQHDARAELSRLLHRLDGAQNAFLILAVLPEGLALDDVDPIDDLHDFIQAAGAASRMTVEVRRHAGGVPEHFVVGRADGHESTVVEWGSRSLDVFTTELFDADAATEAFDEFYRTGWLSPTYSMRGLTG